MLEGDYMGLRIRKSIKLGKYLRLNLNKSGVSLSGGVKGARMSVNSKGVVRNNIGIPGSGIYYSNQQKIKGNPLSTNNRSSNKLFSTCIKTFLGFVLLDAFTLKSTLLMEIVGVIIVISYIGILVNRKA